MKKLSTRQFAAVKRVFKNICAPAETRNKNLTKIAELQEENKTIEAFIEANEAGIKMITDGVPAEALVKKVITETDKIGTNGKPVKVTKYEPSDIVVYDEEENCYYIDEPEVEAPQSTEEIDDSKLDETEEIPSDEGSFNPTKVFSE